MLEGIVRLGSSSSGVMQAQFRSFAKKMPAYYASVIAMMLSVIYVFHGIAPAWAAIGIPSGISLLGTVRGYWWLMHADDAVTWSEAHVYLRRSTWTLIVAVSILMAMDVTLFRYGNDHTRYFLLLQMLACATCGFYCLMHLRMASLVVFAVVMIPFDVLTVSLHQPSATSTAVTATVTAGVMILAMLGYQRDFLNLIRAEADTQKLSQENLHLAQLDMLTGLPNRRYFFDVLASWRPQGEGATVAALGMLDLDGFKPVNDTYGHTVGDSVLAEISARLRSVSERIDHLCRLGGDEFAFLVQAEDEEALRRLGLDIINAVGKPIQVANKIMSVGCSVGFALWPKQGAAEGIAQFEQADYALYHAKRSGRGRTVLFSEEHESLIVEQGKVEQALRSADLQAEFYLMYQPIVELSTGRTLSLECLARWKSSVLGEVPPAVFVPVAERTGLISDLTLVLLGQALRAAEGWPDHIGLSFNVSPYDMTSREQIVKMIEAILASKVSPGRLTLELTETALLNNFAETTLHMEMFRSVGASVALDDFGTGHSSLSYVHSLPFDKIKIDRGFVLNLESNPASRNIMRAVIGLCRDLNVASVVEGVETEAQLQLLQEMGAGQIQGYLFARPMTQGAADAFVEQRISSAAESVLGLHTWQAKSRLSGLPFVLREGLGTEGEWDAGGEAERQRTAG